MKRILTALFCLGAAPLLQGADDFPLVPDDLEVSLFARDPLVRNPCAITFDAKGRLCIGMGPQYRKPTPETPGDSVWILIDRDGDGVADDRKQYATGFNSIQGLAWRGNDLYVANAPELTIARDLDGDDEADLYVRLYTDLGNLEHALHGLNFGPDGKLYMSKGNSKGLTRPPDRVAPKPFRELWGVEAPGVPDFPAPVVFAKGKYEKNYHDPSDDWGLCGGILRCDPDGSNLEIVSRGFRNPWDIAYDDAFNWLGTDNDQTQGDKFFSPFYGAHFGWGHPWSYDWKGDEHLPSAPSAGPLFEGSGTGVAYCGLDHYPQKYRDVFLVNDWLRREVYIYRPRWQGAWMQPDREDLEIFAHAGGGRSMGESSGRSFDPVDIEVGPDGAIYIASWGREYGLKEVDGKQANEGRIYRLWPKAAPPVPEGADPKRAIPEENWSVAQLMEDLADPLAARRIVAQDELVRRGWKAWQDAVADPPKSKRVGAWVLWTLARADLANEAIDRHLAKLLAASADGFDPYQVVRVIAERTRNQKRSQLPDELHALLDHADPRLRHETILAMRLVGETRWIDDLLERLVKEEDRIVYYSAWGALMEFMPREERKALLAHGEAGVRRGALLSLLEEDALSEVEIRALTNDPDAATSELAKRRLGGKAQTEIRGPALNRGQQISGPATPPGRRPVSVVSVIESRPGTRYEEAHLALGARAYTDRTYRITDLPAELEGLTFIRSANNDADHAAGPFLKIKLRYPSTVFLADDTRGDQLPVWARQGWDATGMTLRTDDAAHRIFKAEYPPGEVTFGPNMAGVEGRKANYLVIIKPDLLSPPASVTSVKDVLPLVKDADPERGRALFLNSSGAACATCHQLEGIGNVFAPDLHDLGTRADAEVIARSILEPNAEITEGFAMQIVRKTNRDSVAGIVLQETGLALSLAHVNGEVVTVLKKDIEKRETAPVSAMPPTFASMLRPQDVADVVAYLLRPKDPGSATPSEDPPAAEHREQPPQAAASVPSPLADRTWGKKETGFHLACEDDHLAIHLNGAPIASYYFHHNRTKRPFFAHLKTPGGNQVTRNFPPVEGQDATDHPYMHPGVSLGFANFQGVSFWHNNGGVVVHEKFASEPAAGDTASFAVQNRYLAPDGRMLCREEAHYRFTANEDGYLLEIDSRLFGERSFWLGVREEMGLAIRVATPLTVKNGGSILSASGEKDEAGTWGRIDKWWDYFGDLAGKSAGLQVMTAPGNPPVWSHSRDYGVLVANPLPVDRAENKGKRLLIQPGESFHLRFGVQIHEHGKRADYDPAAAYQRYLRAVKRAP